MSDYKILYYKWYNESATRQIRVSDLGLPKHALFAHDYEVWYSLTDVQLDGIIVAIHASEVYFVE